MRAAHGAVSERRREFLRGFGGFGGSTVFSACGGWGSLARLSGWSAGGSGSALALAGCATPLREREHPALERVFADEGMAGCFALRSAGGALDLVHGRRARQRFIPASTFKLPNSLIALDAAAVRDEREVVPYGGQPQPFPQWERDLNLRDAFAASSVPVYRELARRVGLVRMREAVAALGYGNGEIGTVVDRFWLDGPLAISAVEQTDFLLRLAQRRLPVSARSLALVHDISAIERRDAGVLHAKSGWAFDSQPRTGWWVGWVERDGGPHSFAMNIDMPGLAEAPKRERIARRLLAHFGVWPAAR